jgi:hypothetical protein
MNLHLLVCAAGLRLDFWCRKAGRVVRCNSSFCHTISLRLLRSLFHSDASNTQQRRSLSLLSGFRGLWEWDHEDSFLSCHCSGWLYVKTWLSRLRSLSQILLPRVCNFFDLASSVLLLLLLCLSGWLPRGVHWFAYVPAPETVVSIGQYRLYFCTYLSRVLDWLMPSVWIKRLEWNLSYS